MAMESSLFMHTPLSSPGNIRIIDLLPAIDKDSQVQCNIREKKLEWRWDDRYEALSYVWGRSHKKWSILCNGKELLVTRNCYEALLFLRRSFKPRTLWIDAICIDQSDTNEGLEERTREIPRMGDVYVYASRTVVWLGPGDHSTPAIFRRIKILGQFDRYTEQHPTWAKLARSAVGLQSDIESAVFRSTNHQQSFDQIVNHPWFRRAWTAQECAFPHKCVAISGRSIVTFDELCKFLLQYLNRDFYRSILNLVAMRAMLKQRLHFLSNGKDSMAYVHPAGYGNLFYSILPREWTDISRPQEFHILSSMAYLEATIPQDRVFGLHSALHAMGIKVPDPLYEKSLPEICREVASAYITSRRTLDILCLTLPSSDHDAFPSWVPAWDKPLQNTTRVDESGIAIIRQTSKMCRATMDTWAYFTDDCLEEISSFKAHKLKVRGKIMGQITKKISCGPQSESQLLKGGYRVVTATCSLWCEMVANRTSYPLPGCDRIRAAYNVMLSHVPKVIEGTHERTYEQFQKWFKKMKLYKENPTAFEPEGIEASILEDPDLSHIHLEICEKANYALFSLDTGHLGMAHYTCTAGDYLVLLAGLSYPLLLRRAALNEYRIVAPAYCHGMMDGECWDGDVEFREVHTEDLERLSTLTIV